MKTVVGAVTAPIYIGYLATTAMTGDAASQATLKDLVVNAAVTVTDLPAAAQRMMAQADAAEAAGNPSLAAQIRTELVVNTALLGYSAMQLVRSAGTTSMGPASSTNAAGRTVFNGVELNPGLPAPAAGLSYSPTYGSIGTDASYYSHWTGFQAEIKLANTIADQGQTVVKWGDKIGANGSDVISINTANNAEVVLWDSKFRSADVSVSQSPTFSDALKRQAAIEEAEQTIRASSLPAQAQQQALRNLEAGNFTTNTVGAGGVKNSVVQRYCSFEPC